jgi:integrase/recombinase XerD
LSPFDDCLIGVAPGGGVQARLGVGLLDGYLEFVAARCRPNTVLAVAFDLKVFFAFVSKPAPEVCSGDVLAFISAQRAGGDGRGVRAVDEVGGLSSRTVARRLSSVSGLFGYLLARGDVTANPVPPGLPTRQLGRRQRGGAGAPAADVAPGP